MISPLLTVRTFTVGLLSFWMIVDKMRKAPFDSFRVNPIEIEPDKTIIIFLFLTLIDLL
jgi:hypothetical protein